MSTKAVRAAIAAVLNDAALGSGMKLRAYGTAPNDPQPPCVIVWPRRIAHQVTYDGAGTLGFALEVLTPSTMEHGQDLLDDLLDVNGIIATLIAAHKTLGGTVQDSWLEGMEPDSYGTVGLGADPNRRCYVARMNLEVFV